MKLYTKISVISLSFLLNLIFLLLLLWMRIAPLVPSFKSDNSFFYEADHGMIDDETIHENIALPMDPEKKEDPQEKPKEIVEWVSTQRSEAIDISMAIDTQEQKQEHEQEQLPDDSPSHQETIPEPLPIAEEEVFFEPTLHDMPQKSSELRPLPLTLAQLAQGFLNKKMPTTQVGSQRLNYGNAPVSAIGKKGGIMTAQQMRIMNYFRKIEDAFINEMHINSHVFTNIRKKYPRKTYQLQLFFSLTREGKIERCVIKDSCGTGELDAFILYVFKQSSSSFPPVPVSMADDPLEFGYLLAF